MRFLRFSIVIAIAVFVAPVIAQELEYIGSYPTDFSKFIQVDGNYAYIIDSSDFVAIDISVPSSPMFLSRISIPGQPGRFDIEGDYAYIAAGDSGLQIVDIANRTQPIMAGNFATPRRALDIVLDSTLAYLMDEARLRILDISNPASPAELGSINFYGGNEAIAYIGNYVYLVNWATESDMLAAINVEIPSDPQRTDWVIAGMFNSRLYISGTSLFVVNQPYYFSIWDISTPGHFDEGSSRNGGMQLAGLTALSFISNLALASLGANGLAVIDFSEPDSCVEILRLDTPGYAEDICVSGNYVFVADTDSLLIFRYLPNGVGTMEDLPFQFGLNQNYPNPFNATTTISFSLESSGPVTLEIFDLLGRKVATLLDDPLSAGEHQVVWGAGNRVSGTYFLSLRSGKQTAIRRITLLK